ncbi:LOW QUALITY PROTEIN: hypothetical protein PHMEG_00024525 [Phytophthora megakarya]|uniref:Uncharacterized protein n=1 Tax=Phytophthora megakarya TaxID=4795 RepID=A0A225VDI2_9STRA|nr:LOW QUALITY PROTEIN: hypothetical protein PHMEG_00024525 [Phytophthora megakarya]
MGSPMAREPTTANEIEIQRLSSGRWRDMPTFSTSLPLLSIRGREGYGDRSSIRCIQDQAVETYAMRVCEGQSVISLMPEEMRSIHTAAYNVFHARVRPATRSISERYNKIGSRQCLKPQFRSLLSMFRTMCSITTDNVVILRVWGYVSLQESDDDSDINPGALRGSRAINAILLKTTRGPDLSDFGIRAQTRRLKEDAGIRGLPATPLPILGIHEAEKRCKGHFRASSLQTTVHQAIVNGTYCEMGSQLFIEHLQAQVDLLAFVPHPAVLKGFFVWEFGTRGLSVLHFGQIDGRDRRLRLAKYDMCDFLNRNSLPPADPAEGLDDILAALDIQWMYLPYWWMKCTNLMSGDYLGSKVLSPAKMSYFTTDKDTLADLVFWIDERLEKVRTFIVLGSADGWDFIQQEFNVAHESYLQAQNIINERQYSALKNSHNLNKRRETRNPIEGRQGSSAEAEVKRVSAQVLKSLSTEKVKALCMRFLFNRGFRGRGSRCTYYSRGHFALDGFLGW